jgi:renalase
VQAGHQVSVFEQHPEPGGRTRSVDSPFGSFDAGAQYFTVRDPRLERVLQTQPGLCRPWSASTVRVLDAAGRVVAASPVPKDPHWVAAPRMDALVQAWATPLQDAGHLHTDAQVVRMEPDRLRPGAWQLTTVSKDGARHVHAGFDAVLLAMPAIPAQTLLADVASPLAKNLSGVAMAPCWTLMLAYPQAVQPGLTTLGPQWNAQHAAPTTASPGWRANRPSPAAALIERWTVQASPEWSAEHLEDDPARVLAKLRKAFAEVTGIRTEPAHAELQRWRHAHAPRNPWGQSHLWDAPAGPGRVRRLVPGPPPGRRLRLGPGTGTWPWHEPGRGQGGLTPGPVCSFSHRPLACGLARGRWPVGWMRAATPAAGWLVRIEDVDTPRCQPGAGEHILAQLAACGLVPDEAPVCGSPPAAPCYQQALDRLVQAELAYPCACSRKDIEAAHCWPQGHPARAPRRAALPRHLPPGPAGPQPPCLALCHHGLHTKNGLQRPLIKRKQLLFSIANGTVRWQDRRLGAQQQDVASAWATSCSCGQTACGPTSWPWWWTMAHRPSPTWCAAKTWPTTPRARSCCNTHWACPRQQYLHTPLVRGCDGEKLSKQNGAAPLELDDPVAALGQAAAVLGLAATGAFTQHTPAQALAQWVKAWAANLQSGTVTETMHPSPRPCSRLSAPPPAGTTRPAARPRACSTPKPSRALCAVPAAPPPARPRPLKTSGPRFILPYAAAPLDAPAAFGREAPLILEIGFGMGEATAHIARVRPEDNFLCCEVHEPGVGALLKRIGEQGLHQHPHPAARRCRGHRPHAGTRKPVRRAHVFFPDPWHKNQAQQAPPDPAPLVAKLAARLQALAATCTAPPTGSPMPSRCCRC